MNQGQATVEYLGLVLAGLVVACLLVQAATPVEQLALAVVHTVVPARHRVHPIAPHPHHRGTHHRKKPPCTCISGSTWPQTGRLTHGTPSSFSATGGFSE
jgi:hypothetical protein